MGYLEAPLSLNPAEREQDVSSECLRIGARLFRDTTSYPSRRHSSPAFALLVDTLRYRS
jgi:hypothetical protein